MKPIPDDTSSNAQPCSAVRRLDTAMRVLICRSNPIAPDPRVEKIARALTNFGYSVQCLGWDRTGQLATSAQLETPGLDNNTGTPIHIYRLSIIAPFGHGLNNLPNLLRWQSGLLAWLIRHRGEYDLIHACDFDTILPALLVKRLYGKKVIYDIFDFYADHLRATPTWLKKTIRNVDLWAIGKADALILVDDSRWEQIDGANPRLSAVIYNSPGEALIPEADDLAKEPGCTLRLAYIGLLQVERGLTEMLQVLKIHPEWHLDLAGFGGDEETIRTAAASLKNVHWHGRVPYERALQLSQAADVLFALYDPAIPNHRYSSPNKVFEAMMLGKPIIVARSTNMDTMIERLGCGLVVAYGNIPELEQALLRLQQDPHFTAQLGVQARKAYDISYSWNEMQLRLCKLYQQVLAPATSK